MLDLISDLIELTAVGGEFLQFLYDSVKGLFGLIRCLIGLSNRDTGS